MTAHHCSLFDSSASPTEHHPTGVIPMDDLMGVPSLWREILAAPLGAALLGPPRSRMLVLAAGPLVAAARSLAAMREEHRWGATDALPADEPRIWRDWDCVLALSATGAEPELLHALRHLPPRVPRVGVIAPGGERLGPLVDELVTLPEASVESLAAFETGVLLAVRDGLGDDLAGLPRAAEQVLVSDIPEAAPRTPHVALVGSGWTQPLAVRGAHILGAAPGIRVEAFSSTDVRYGALEHADRSSLVWFLGRANRDLVEAAQSTGALVTASSRDALVDLVAVHRLARELRSPVMSAPVVQPGTLTLDS